jgi:hypothetical protein
MGQGDSMDPKDILSFVFQRADATQTFWNFFATVATAILGFVAAAKTEWLNRITRSVLTLGFAIFAFANFQALNVTRVQVEQLIALLKNTNLAGIGESARPSPFYRLLLFHLCLDVTVLALIWIIPRIRSADVVDE